MFWLNGFSAPNNSVPRFKQSFSFVVPSTELGNEFAALDLLKVCDTTVFLVSANVPEDEIYGKWGRRFINMAAAQGVPTPIISLMDLESIAPNRRGKVKNTIQKYVQKSFPIEKVISLDTNSDGFNLFRRIGDQKKKVLHNKDNRPHLFAENIEYVENTTDPNAGTLKVTGYLRGIPLDVNSLVHIPNLGDFQMSQIDLVDETNGQPGTVYVNLFATVKLFLLNSNYI